MIAIEPEFEIRARWAMDSAKARERYFAMMDDPFCNIERTARHIHACERDIINQAERIMEYLEGE